MTRLFHKIVCHFLGHTTKNVPFVFFRSWDGLTEIGSLHCKRCGAMVGEYKRNLEELVNGNVS
jgi:hypothetical protein